MATEVQGTLYRYPTFLFGRTVLHKPPPKFTATPHVKNIFHLFFTITSFLISEMEGLPILSQLLLVLFEYRTRQGYKLP